MTEQAEIEAMLAKVSETAKAQRSNEEFLYHAVEWLRAHDVSWETIGEALGVTRQAASQTHRDRTERRKCH